MGARVAHIHSVTRASDWEQELLIFTQWGEPQNGSKSCSYSLSEESLKMGARVAHIHSVTRASDWEQEWLIFTQWREPQTGMNSSRWLTNRMNSSKETDAIWGTTKARRTWCGMCRSSPPAYWCTTFRLWCCDTTQSQGQSRSQPGSQTHWGASPADSGWCFLGRLTRWPHLRATDNPSDPHKEQTWMFVET